MGLFWMFRDSKSNLERTLAAIYEAIAQASDRSCETLLKEIRSLTGDAFEWDARWRIRCEWWFFYVCLMDWFAFRTLGERRRDIIIHRGVGVALTQLVQHHLPMLDEEERGRTVAQLIETGKERGSYYEGATEIFAGPVPGEGTDLLGINGLSDAVPNEPKAMTFRLARLLQEGLCAANPEFGRNSDFARAGGGKGMTPQEAIFPALFMAVQISAMENVPMDRIFQKVREVDRYLR